MSVRVVAGDAAGIAWARELLERGQLVAIPTETVYGLAARAFDEEAVARVFDVKERPRFDPLIVHVVVEPNRAPWDALAPLVDVPALGAAGAHVVERLAGAFWPGPLTLVLPRRPGVPDLVTAGLPTVAVRAPSHPVARALLRAAGPLAAPSANRFGRISPTTAAAVVAELGDRIPLVVDGGPCEVGLESTIVDLAGGALSVLRPGRISAAALEEVAGTPVRSRPSAGVDERAVTAPGQLASHYAPRTPLVLLPGLVSDGGVRAVAPRVAAAPGGRLGLLLWAGDPAPAAARVESATGRAVVARSLSRTGDPLEAARVLFARMRDLDAAGCVLLLAEPIPADDGTRGILFALRDRLTRAAAAAKE